MSTQPVELTPYQSALTELPLAGPIFLEGPAGSGKTTAAANRMLRLLREGIPPGSVLLLLAQRALAGPYLEALEEAGFSGGDGDGVTMLTLSGLAQRMIHLFWPQAAASAGFGQPAELPTFLTAETAQYFMARVIRPLLLEGLFEGVTLEPHRIYSQVLDNLSRAAVVGFPYTETGERLKAARPGDTASARLYDDVQAAAHRFRLYCLEHNLLDFSLQVEVFVRHLWPLPDCREHLVSKYRHLFVDNLEEDTPATHDLLREWLPQAGSALLVYDRDGGLRSLLGADPHSAFALKEVCQEQVAFEQSLVAPEGMGALEATLAAALGRRPSTPPQADLSPVLDAEMHRFYPEMLDGVAAQVASLVNDQGVPPAEIAILAPSLPGALRYALEERLKGYQVTVRSQRPTRLLRDEPAVQCLLTLAALANPAWKIRPPGFDVAYALVQAIRGMDLVRAQMLVEAVYRTRQGRPTLDAFEDVNPQVQERISPLFGERYERLRLWLADYADPPPIAQVGQGLNAFLSRLSEELLSLPGFGFQDDPNAVEAAANLVESVEKFNAAAGKVVAAEGGLPGKEYLLVLQEGLLAAHYLRSWQTHPPDAVLLAPAYTFVMRNRPVDYQFWLDVGSRAWQERPSQPLTHPYVLSRNWPRGRAWTDLDELEAGREALYRLALGLARRCRRRISLGLTEFSEQGYEQRGPLLAALQTALRASPDVEA